MTLLREGVGNFLRSRVVMRDGAGNKSRAQLNNKVNQMKKLWLLALAVGIIAVSVGCAKEETPPTTNPTGEKSADDKSAAGASGATTDAGSTPPITSEPPAEKSVVTKKGPDEPVSSEPVKEKPADDSGITTPAVGNKGQELKTTGQ